jgi:hypothetical protein
MLPTSIWDDLGSNHRDTEYRDNFCGFTQHFQAHAGIVPQARPFDGVYSELLTETLNKI